MLCPFLVYRLVYVLCIASIATMASSLINLSMTYETRKLEELTKPFILPVTIVTGFLGSGKTTLLKNVLAKKVGTQCTKAVSKWLLTYIPLPQYTAESTYCHTNQWFRFLQPWCPNFEKSSSRSCHGSTWKLFMLLAFDEWNEARSFRRFTDTWWSWLSGKLVEL